MARYTLSAPASVEEVRPFLLTDPAYAAYALADLEPPYCDHATWRTASLNATVVAAALLYEALDPPILFLMGQPDALAALLKAGFGPDSITLNAPADLRELVLSFYRVDPLLKMHRMQLHELSFPREPGCTTPGASPHRLEPGHAKQVARLITTTARHDSRDIRDIAFDPGMLASGVYFGIHLAGSLVAVAGTHVIAPRQKIAAVGNVMVHPDHRGHGLGRCVSHAVTAALLADGFQQIVLNVRQNNLPALRIYERLGYRIACPFLEGVGVRASRPHG
jgi:ribosomal protein S18 acetylase RimI-like enzyme